MSQKEAFEPTGLIPRSIIRTVDRFLQQLFPGKERIAVQEYRVSRYQILVSIKSLLIITCIPLLINYTLKALLLTPLTEHFWNSYQGDLFLNQYQEKRAFSEMNDFSEKMFFELLLEGPDKQSLFPKSSESSLSLLTPSKSIIRTPYQTSKASPLLLVLNDQPIQEVSREACINRALVPTVCSSCSAPPCFALHQNKQVSVPSEGIKKKTNLFAASLRHNICFSNLAIKGTLASDAGDESGDAFGRKTDAHLVYEVLNNSSRLSSSLNNRKGFQTFPDKTEFALSGGFLVASPPNTKHKMKLLPESFQEKKFLERRTYAEEPQKSSYLCTDLCTVTGKTEKPILLLSRYVPLNALHQKETPLPRSGLRLRARNSTPLHNIAFENTHNLQIESVDPLDPYIDINERGEEENSYSTFLLRDYSKAAFQAKSIQVAQSYNKQSILAITNLLGDFVTFLTVCSLFRIMRPEIIILKSFLTESVYSLSDTTKSFLLILGMDLLVGFHSPRGWEIVLEGLLRHVGLPENENFVLLFVALFPVFLDTVFKYWIFRYLNKISPSTVVTYHSMIE